MDEIDRPVVDMDLLAASLRADSSDLNAFIESLAAKLEEAMPGRVRVDRRRAGMFGPKSVRSVSVDLGDRRLELRSERGAVQTRCARLSGGIVLKNEELGTDAWLAVLSEALAAEAARSETTRKALERLLIQ
ncbi:MAG TPA: hypothetical protein VLW51_10290 [Solirubrobacteraceae bacterium]|nr:hypothetical protein [Solirubrobacteraceae bacterium]